MVTESKMVRFLAGFSLEDTDGGGRGVRPDL